MKLQFLQTLAAVLQHGSFAAAAKDVNLTASAVGLQMRQLEDFFGQPLFDRSARQVRPTPFAHEIAGTLAQAVDALEALRSRRDGPALTGRLRLGTVESAQVTLLPAALQVLREQGPALQFAISRGTSSALLDEVKAGRIDAAVLVRPQSGGSRRLAWTPLARETMVLIAPPDARPAPPVEMLRRYDWIRMDLETTGGRIAAQYVHRIAPRMRCAFDLPGSESIAAMVSAGLGVSVVPALRQELLQAYPVLQVPLGKGAPIRHLALVCRHADADGRLMRAVVEAFRAAAHRRFGADAVAAADPRHRVRQRQNP
ncbi:LysR family transcriptional regulator [Xylophilus sp.]|uniref:LysR family transcriptional regulator n=1 Tax=Xylophilus sp. TaxID=2653893 RepID=UPI0013BDE5E2|nr:LysR family transcriptional regulator [Xylophilus sp.]KAF1050072.1 MAG: Hydrogen peroxide-inducible genes activator [Xylophilus sp.]